MNYKIINNVNEFEEIKESWEKLYNSLDNVYVFQSYEWAFSWTVQENIFDNLFIIVFYKKRQNELCGILPLYISSKNILRLIADTHTDYSNFLIMKMDNLDLYDLFKTFHKIVHKEPKIKSIELKNIDMDNIFLGNIDFIFNDRKIIYQSNAASYTVLKSHEGLFKCFSHLKSSQRSELKRVYKKNEMFESRVYDSSSTLFPGNKVKKLINKMVDNSSRGEAFLDDKMLTIITDLYNNGQLLINEIRHNNDSIAMNFILYKNNKYIFWIDIYDNYRFINIYAYLKFMEYICTDNKDIENIFDFGRGLYNYKIKNFYPVIKSQVTFFYSKKNSIYILYLLKLFFKLIVKNFYKKNKVIINKILGRS